MLYHKSLMGTFTAPGKLCKNLHNYLRSIIYYSYHKIPNIINYYGNFIFFNMCLLTYLYLTYFHHLHILYRSIIFHYMSF